MEPRLLLQAVRDRIASRGLDARSAAREIGVTDSSLKAHLNGGYVRSDSLAKYRSWLEGKRPSAEPRNTRQLSLIAVNDDRGAVDDDDAVVAERRLLNTLLAPRRPHLVVDLFSGCGGMSIGFDLFGRGDFFRTVLAVDVERTMVRAFNANNRSGEGAPVCRCVDLTDFESENEVLAFFLDHLGHVTNDGSLAAELADLPWMSLEAFKRCVRALDASFLSELAEIRKSGSFKKSYQQLDPRTLQQTSVVGFHAELRLPMPSSRLLAMPPIVWADDAPGEAMSSMPASPQWLEEANRSKPALNDTWDRKIAELREKAKARGRGQLASSAARIAQFLRFMACEAGEATKSAWVNWRASRDALRRTMFGNQHMRRRLSEMYSGDRKVAVILGGPPCQGFSRIGRGKIRSLREHGVHVQVDAETGDVRNRLLHKYVLFVSALAPDVFLFENVRHFQSEVQTPEGSFQATDVLAEAIRELSENHLSYEVRSRVIDCSRHGVPQTRERFFMIGCRSNLAPALVGDLDVPHWCLCLPTREEIPLIEALRGLPSPHLVGAGGGDLRGTVKRLPRSRDNDGATGEYLDWLEQQPLTGSGNPSEDKVDAHHVRLSRADDRALFELLGPGRRWMDYRCDNAETLRELRAVLASVAHHLRAADQKDRTDSGLKIADIESLLSRLDGSLSLRLLLESIPPLPGELQHHLLTEGYLQKRDGNHGDWLSRLRPDRPCKTIVSHMGKDTYAYVHPYEPRTLSVREAARVQTFPDWFRFGDLSLVDAYRVIGNAVPPFLSHQLASRIAELLALVEQTAEQCDSPQPQLARSSVNARG